MISSLYFLPNIEQPLHLMHNGFRWYKEEKDCIHLLGIQQQFTDDRLRNDCKSKATVT
jgi:hypothetical protein